MGGDSSAGSPVGLWASDPSRRQITADHTKGLKNRSHVGLGLGTDLIVIVSHCLLISLCVVLVSFPGLGWPKIHLHAIPAAVVRGRGSRMKPRSGKVVSLCDFSLRLRVGRGGDLP